MQDIQGLSLSGATADALQPYEEALAQLRTLTGDPASLVDRAIAVAPGFTMAHAAKAWLNLLGTEPAGHQAAVDICAQAQALPANERERMHLQAATLLAHQHWQEAGRLLEDIALAWPHDLLALQAGHLLDFYIGDSRMLRDRIARALPQWDRGRPGYPALLGMHAFGLEETGHYTRAEQQGRLCVELEPHDSWGWHAVAHVHEMRNDPEAGVAWLQPHVATWAEGSFLAVHNWWHLALFLLELDRVDEVLRLYDERVANGSILMLDMVDSTALLWRLQLRGVGVGDRWKAVADLWQAHGTPGLYAFNDLHMMMAYVATDRQRAQAEVLQAQEEALVRDDDNALFTRLVGADAVQAVHAFGNGQYAEAVRRLRRVRSGAHRFGGSHAQRDVIDQTLLASARRAGLQPLAGGLLAERVALRPRTRATAWTES